MLRFPCYDNESGRPTHSMSMKKIILLLFGFSSLSRLLQFIKASTGLLGNKSPTGVMKLSCITSNGIPLNVTTPS